MKNKKNILGLALLGVFLLTGCGTSKALVENYDKMQVSKDTINGYQLDLRIYGIYNDKTINEIIKIDNYLNTQYKITTVGLNSDRETAYILDGVNYKLDKDSKYTKTTDAIAYSNPNLYLEALNSLKSSEKGETETIASVDYTSYSVTVKASKMEEILETSTLTDIKFKKNIPAKVLIDADGYVYKIVYYLNEAMGTDVKKLEVSATYFRINKSSEITIDETVMPEIETSTKGSSKR